jgi:hypothetical protein
MNNREKAKQLVEATLNEVRLPTGYFMVVQPFTLPSADKEWESVFGTGDTIKLDPASKSIKTLNKTNNEWNDKDISLLDLMQPQQYKIFASSVRKLTPEEVKELKGEPKTTATEFTTTLRGLAKRTQELKLPLGTKIKVTIIK